MQYKFFYTILLIYLFKISAGVPPSLPKCNLTDIPSALSCIEYMKSNLWKRICKGDSAMQLPSVDPFQLGDCVLENSEELRFILKKIVLYNMCKFETDPFRTSIDITTFKWSLVGSVDCLKLKGLYEIDGCIKDRNYLGKGNVEIDLTNVEEIVNVMANFNIDFLKLQVNNFTFTDIASNNQAQNMFILLDGLTLPENHGNVYLNQDSTYLYERIGDNLNGCINRVFLKIFDSVGVGAPSWFTV